MKKGRRAGRATAGNSLPDAARGWEFFMWRWNAPHLGWI